MSNNSQPTFREVPPKKITRSILLNINERTPPKPHYKKIIVILSDRKYRVNQALYVGTNNQQDDH